VKITAFTREKGATKKLLKTYKNEKIAKICYNKTTDVQGDYALN